MGRWSECFFLKPDPFGDQKNRGLALRVCLFLDVTNVNEIREMLRDGKIDCALIRAELILETFQILAAANRAVHCAENNKLSTKSIHTEIVYALSPTKNITESLLTFGISDESRNVLVAVVDDEKGDKLTKVARKIKGKPAPLTRLKDLADYDLVKKVYHVREPELNKGSILDAIVTRIVAKDYVASS